MALYNQRALPFTDSMVHSNRIPNIYAVRSCGLHLFLLSAACGASGDPGSPAETDATSAASSPSGSDPQTSSGGSTSSDPAGASDASSGGDSASDDASSDAGAGPIIIEFSVNTTEVDETDILIFSAIVTDPDGIDDVIGGSLRTPTGNTYGAFQTSSSEGAYEISLDWDALSTTALIDALGPRTFVAEFFDQTGASASESVSIELTCSSSADLCTPGVCTRVDTPERCGSCDFDCGSAIAPESLGWPQDVALAPDSVWTTNDSDLWCSAEASCNLALRIGASVFFPATCIEVCEPWTAVDAWVVPNDESVPVDEIATALPRDCLCEL